MCSIKYCKSKKIHRKWNILDSDLKRVKWPWNGHWMDKRTDIFLHADKLYNLQQNIGLTEIHISKNKSWTKKSFKFLQKLCRLLPQLSWECGKLQFARWSQNIALFSTNTTHSFHFFLLFYKLGGLNQVPYIQPKFTKVRCSKTFGTTVQIKFVLVLFVLMFLDKTIFIKKCWS